LLAVQINLANTYSNLGRLEEARQLERDVYRGSLRLLGEEDEDTLTAANNYAASLVSLERFEQAKSVLRKTLPVARRALGENDETALRMRWYYAEALYEDPNATLDDLRESVATLEDTERTARRVLGGAHPTTVGIEGNLRKSRQMLRARETH
jgi:tetratricopeptide (TPR) repeat protein